MKEKRENEMRWRWRRRGKYIIIIESDFHRAQWTRSARSFACSLEPGFGSKVARFDFYRCFESFIDLARSFASANTAQLSSRSHGWINYPSVRSIDASQRASEWVRVHVRGMQWPVGAFTANGQAHWSSSSSSRKQINWRKEASQRASE